MYDIDIHAFCGVDEDGRGTYTTECITKLCEGLKGSSVTWLECVTKLTPIMCSPCC